MQILLNHGEVGQAVINLINEKVLVGNDEVVHVTLTEDGATVFILPEGVAAPADEEGNEPTGSEPSQSTGETQRRRRRTKAQIAEEERLAAEQAEAAKTVAVASSTVEPVAEAQAVVAEVVGETTQEQSAGGEAEVAADPIVESTVAVEEPGVAEPEVETQAEAEPVVETQAEAVATEAAVKPAGVSLFANLRRPNNG